MMHILNGNGIKQSKEAVNEGQAPVYERGENLDTHEGVTNFGRLLNFRQVSKEGAKNFRYILEQGMKNSIILDSLGAK